VKAVKLAGLGWQNGRFGRSNLQAWAENLAGLGGQIGRFGWTNWQAAVGFQRALPAGCDDGGGERNGVAVASHKTSAHSHQAGR